eukprot:568252-Amphidinium_carterae.1
MVAMTEPPLSIDSESVRSDAAWAKALERLKRCAEAKQPACMDHWHTILNWRFEALDGSVDHRREVVL